MFNLILWSFLIYGLNIVVLRSKLFNPIRNFVVEKLQKEYLSKQKENPEGKVRSIDFKESNSIYSFINSLLNCWICVSFWSGFCLSMMGMHFINNDLLQGVLAVGLMGLINRIER